MLWELQFFIIAAKDSSAENNQWGRNWADLAQSYDYYEACNAVGEEGKCNSWPYEVKHWQWVSGSIKELGKSSIGHAYPALQLEQVQRAAQQHNYRKEKTKNGFFKRAEMKLATVLKPVINNFNWKLEYGMEDALWQESEVFYRNVSFILLAQVTWSWLWWLHIMKQYKGHPSLP